MYKNKIWKVMIIFLLWLGIVCCSVANGLIYDHVNTPERYYYMVVPSVVAVILLIIHRVYTRDWTYPKKKSKKKVQVQYHNQVFGVSALFSSAFMVAGLLTANNGEMPWGMFVGGLTAFVVFAVATIKESDYIWNLLAVRIGSLIFYDDLFYFCLSLAFYIWKFTLII